MEEKVYHGGSIGGITSFIPQTSTHNEKRVYAVSSPEVAVCFIPRSSDIDFHIGRYNGEFQIIERREGAFKKYFIGKQGFLYTLPGESFIANKTDRSEELVSEQIVLPLEEIFIQDIYVYLQGCIKEGSFSMIYFNKQPEWLTSLDNNDIVDKVTMRSIQLDKQDYYLSYVREVFPSLEQRIIDKIKYTKNE